MSQPSIYERLAARLGPKGYSTDQDMIAPHLVEWRGRYRGETPFLALPANVEEVRAIVDLCRETNTPITPQGGNTGLVAGQIPQGEILLSLKRMDKIRSVDARDDAIVAEAGVVLTRVQEAAREVNRLFPLSLASQGSATIGGLISTNAGGVHVVRYGMMRDLVLGIEAVMADGSVLNGLKTLRKDNTGYDLKQLLIGAEGTLGIITAASLKLFPAVAEHVVAVAKVEHPDAALDLLHLAKSRTGAVAAFEIMNRLSVEMTVKNVSRMRDPLPGAPYLALMEFESVVPGALRTTVEGLLNDWLAQKPDARDAVIAENQAQALSFWALREAMSAGHRPEGAQVNHDVSIPVSRVPDFLARTEQALNIAGGPQLVAFGHIGDGNIHYSVIQQPNWDEDSFQGARYADIVHENAVALGGSISAEHGIGVSRRDDFARFKDGEQVALMRLVKGALDPNRLMNPRALV